MGNEIWTYADFAQAGVYAPFPSSRDYRISIHDLKNPEILERLYLIWTDPLSLNPALKTESATNDIAEILARLAASFEKSGYQPEMISKFMMRSIFCMYAEDVELLPKDSFISLLVALRDSADAVLSGDARHLYSTIELTNLWSMMNKGGYSPVIKGWVKRFVGPLFATEAVALPMTVEQLDILIEAARAHWAYVDTAIFGTLLERTLTPEARHRMGTHYTPTAYVERLVAPTIMESLTLEWRVVQDRALAHVRAGERDKAKETVRAFHRQLCETTVLDPATGGGNFLQVAMKNIKGLEGEVLSALVDLGDLNYVHDDSTPTVNPRQFRGIEINPHAADIAELALWIGYLQFHFKNNGRVPPAEPIIPDGEIIERRDAILSYDVTEKSKYDNPRPAADWPTVTYVERWVMLSKWRKSA